MFSHNPSNVEKLIKDVHSQLATNPQVPGDIQRNLRCVLDLLSLHMRHNQNTGDDLKNRKEKLIQLESVLIDLKLSKEAKVDINLVARFLKDIDTMINDLNSVLLPKLRV